MADAKGFFSFFKRDNGILDEVNNSNNEIRETDSNGISEPIEEIKKTKDFQELIRINAEKDLLVNSCIQLIQIYYSKLRLELVESKLFVKETNKEIDSTDKLKHDQEYYKKNIVHENDFIRKIRDKPDESRFIDADYFYKSIIRDLVLYGNSFAYIDFNSKPKRGETVVRNLVYIPNNYITAMYDDKLGDTIYTLTGNLGGKYNKLTRLKSSEVLHFKSFPTGGYNITNMSGVKAGAEQALKEYNYVSGIVQDYILNEKFQTEVILHFKDGVQDLSSKYYSNSRMGSKDEVERQDELVAKYINNFNKMRMNGSTSLVGSELGDGDIKTIQSPNIDLDKFTTKINDSKRQLVKSLNIPQALIGLSNEYDAMELKNFINYIIFLGNRITSELNLKLILESNRYFKYNPLPLKMEVEGNSDSVLNTLIKIGAITKNEMRESYGLTIGTQDMNDAIQLENYIPSSMAAYQSKLKGYYDKESEEPNDQNKGNTTEN